MRLLFVSNFFPPYVVGGAEIVTHRQAVEMAARGHEVSVFAGRIPDKDTSAGQLEIEQGDGFPIYRFTMQSLDPEKSAFSQLAASALRSVINRQLPDVVHFHNVAGLGANLIPLARQMGCATIVTLHDYWGICHKNTLLLEDGSVCGDRDQCQACLTHIISDAGAARPIRLRRDYTARCLETADLLVAPSKSLAAVYQQDIGTKQVQYRSNGIDLSKFVHKREEDQTLGGTVRFLFVGYLGVHKGVNVLLDACRKVVAEREYSGRWKLSILGAGRLQGEVEKLIRSIPGNVVEYLGKRPRDDVPEILAGHDVIILPSVWPENEPVALLEAVATGMAQIATNLGGNADLVDHRKSGILIEPDNCGALADAMIAFIKEPDLVQRYSKYNKERRHKFADKPTFDGYERDYKKLLAGTPNSWRKAPVIICGSGWPDLNATSVVNSFAALYKARITPRFIPVEWATVSDWQDACVFWEWTNDGDRSHLRRALSHGIPIALLKTHELSVISQLQPSPVVTYQNTLEAVAILGLFCDEALSENDATTTSVKRAGLATELTTLFDQAHTFALKIEQDFS